MSKLPPTPLRHPNTIRTALFALLLVTPTRTVHANAVEDMFAVGARTKAMGGAGTALSNDYGAVYHNPAGLSFCPGSSVSVAYSHLQTELQIDDNDAYPAADAQELRDSLAIGLCVPLPLDFSFGMHFSMSLERPMALDQRSLDPQPVFFMYGKRLDAFSIMLALSYEIVAGLSVGAGAAVLANSSIELANAVPVVTDSAVRSDFVWDMNPTAAVYAGLQYAIIPELTVGATYRSPLYHRLEVDADTRVEAAGVLLDVDLIMQGQMWYSPQQVALGATYRPSSEWTLTADVTWYNWAAYSGPFVVSTPQPDSDVAKTLRFPPREDLDFSDIVVPRVGAEYVYDNMLAVRLGYSYRMTPAPTPNGIANLLDSDTQFFSLGAGYYWQPSAPAQAQGQADGQDADADAEPFPLTAVKVDAYFTLAFVHPRTVNKGGSQSVLNDYSFGGFAVDAGLTATVEY